MEQNTLQKIQYAVIPILYAHVNVCTHKSSTLQRVPIFTDMNNTSRTTDTQQTSKSSAYLQGMQNKGEKDFIFSNYKSPLGPVHSMVVKVTGYLMANLQSPSLGPSSLRNMSGACTCMSKIPKGSRNGEGIGGAL